MTEALEKEQKVGYELQLMILGGKVHFSPEDQKQVQALVVNSNKAFRALRYADYIKAVEGEEALVSRYRTATSPK